MRHVLCWVLIVHALHLPVPVPDMDGECRGAPINSLSELHAWHVLMIGVRPNDDIDRGPIHTDGDPQNNDPDHSLFGDWANVASFQSGSLTEFSWLPTLTAWLHLVVQSSNEHVACLRLHGLERKPVVPIARVACVCFCSWQI